MEFQSKILHPTGIYRILNKTANIAYIGQTSIDFVGRWNSHVKALNKQTHKNPYLQRVWNKYGPSVFIASVELYIPYEGDEDIFYKKLDDEERRILRLYLEHYNLMEAGEDRMYFSEESRARASYAAKHRKITKEEREIWESKRLAAVRSESSRQKRSEAHKKMWKDPGYKQILVEAYNKPAAVKKKSDGIKASFTKERRAQYTQMNIDRWANPEFKAKAIESIKAAHNTEEGKKIYSEAMKRGWIKRKENMKTLEYQIKEKQRIEKIKATKLRKKLGAEAEA